jgi:hypothetical protein
MHLFVVRRSGESTVWRQHTWELGGLVIVVKHELREDREALVMFQEVEFGSGDRRVCCSLVVAAMLVVLAELLA